jgi:RNA polymerase sigma-70 factor (ECF subfamily)
MQTEINREQEAQHIRAAQQGDQQAYGQLVQLHESMLTTFARYRLPYAEEADEAVQDTFIRAYEQLSDFRPDADFGTWLRSICRFMILSRVKRYTRRKAKHDDYRQQIKTLSLQHLASIEPPACSACDPAEQLEACRKTLSESNQTLIHSRYREDLSIQQISEKTGRTETWVTSTLHRVRSALRTCIEKRIKEQTDENECPQ